MMYSLERVMPCIAVGAIVRWSGGMTSTHLQIVKLFSGICVAAVVGSSLLIGNSVKASEVDPKIHNLCVEAKDYAGCVRAMKGDTSPAAIRTINSQGADIAEGNQCPSGSAYMGGGNCQQVQCEYTTAGAIRALGHDSLIAGKKDKNGKDVWGCPYKLFLGRGRLRLTGAVLRTTNNSACPTGEPKLGFNNTCQTVSRDWLSPTAAAEKANREGPKCDFKLMAYDCSYDAYLVANPAIKQWAELNPAMAEKERARLQSID